MTTEPAEAIALMTTEEVADAIRMAAKTVRALAASEAIPHYRIGGQYRFAAADVARWIESNKSTPGEGS